MADIITLELMPTQAEIDLNITELPSIELTIGGPQGAKGDKGDTGEGVPAGGTTNQILRKNSNTDHDTEWADETYKQEFTNQSALTINHNLGRDKQRRCCSSS